MKKVLLIILFVVVAAAFWGAVEWLFHLYEQNPTNFEKILPVPFILVVFALSMIAILCMIGAIICIIPVVERFLECDTTLPINTK